MNAMADPVHVDILLGCVLGGACAGASLAGLLFHLLRPRPPGRHRPRG